ncbi:MAG: amidohydrolase family protein [Clostridia bacterium]|nr:amidohydrolase family protein [Clostridia bacterium]
MIIDSHYHYYPTEFNVEEKFAEMEELGISKIALIPPIIPIFKTDPKSLPIKLMKILYGKKFLLPFLKISLSTFTKDKQKIDIMGTKYPLIHRVDNTPTFNIAEKYPDKFFAWCFLNPEIMSEEEIDREYNKRSKSSVFCGVKVHSFYHQYRADKLEHIFTLLQKDKKTLLIHMGFDDYEPILSLADKYPDVNIIMAHCGFPYFQIIWDDIIKRKNIFVDISSSPYVNRKLAFSAVKKLGVDRCIYGCDGPFGAQKNNHFDLGYMIEDILNHFPADVREKVGYKNFEKIIFS